VVVDCSTGNRYQRLYRHEIGDSLVLACEVENHLTIYNSVRPYEGSIHCPLARSPPGTLHPARGKLAVPELAQTLAAVRCRRAPMAAI